VSGRVSPELYQQLALGFIAQQRAQTAAAKLAAEPVPAPEAQSEPEPGPEQPPPKEANKQ